MYRNILVYVDERRESELTVSRVAELARPAGARITLLDVVETLPSYAVTHYDLMEAARMRSILERDRRERLEQLALPLQREGVQTDVQVAAGAPFLEILRRVAEHGHDLVVKTATGAGTAQRSLFGTTAMHLFRKCPAPVWAVNPNAQRHGSRILVAIDPDRNNATRRDLAHKLISVGSELAQLTGGTLDVVHCWQAPGTELLARHVKVDALGRYAEAVRSGAREALDAAVAEFSEQLDPDRVHLVEGHPRERIPELASERGTDIVVMGSLGQLGVRGLLIGATAESVLQNVSCSVLAVKPDGFRSPLSFPPAARAG